MAKDSAAWIELGRSFHQEGTVHLKVCESDFVPLWDGTIQWCSLAERKLLEAHKSEEMKLGKGVQSQRWFCRQTLMPWILCKQLLFVDHFGNIHSKSEVHKHGSMWTMTIHFQKENNKFLEKLLSPVWAKSVGFNPMQ